MKQWYYALALTAALGACQQKNEDKQQTDSTAVAVAPPIDLSNFDTTVSPCEDFFQYVNGGWIKKNPIPETESRWGSFNEVYERNQKILKEIAEKAAEANAPKGSNEQLVGDFYASGMDSLTIEKAAPEWVQAELQAIEAATGKEELLQQWIEQKKNGSRAVLSLFVMPDEKNSEQYAIYIYQGGLGMPDRDYYLKEDEDKQKIREAYKAYLTKLFRLSGSDETAAKQAAETVFGIEKALAEASKSRVELRDPIANYNKMSVEEAEALAKPFSIKNALTLAGAAQAKEVIVGQPNFLKAVARLWQQTPVEDLKLYLKAHALNNGAPYWHHEFVQAHFEFYNKTLRGQKQNKERWKRVLATVDDGVGEALGQLYVQKAFPPEAKAKVMEMIDNLQYAYEQHIKDLDWMSEKTKEEALKKLAAFKRKIGYPDKWKDYSGLEIVRNNYWQNVKNAHRFEFERQVKRLGQPVDKTEWFMTPPTVNAYYNPPMNEIVFPAGILQPPFFDPNADDAVNYGGMGAVIGHELSHGFDDQGRQYDAEGNLRDWWMPEDAERFKERAQALSAQFSSYEVLPGVKVNGDLTLGENIADLGGLAIAYTALQKALEGKERPLIDGFTPEQRFFISWAQVWRTNAREEYLKQQVLVDPHSPARFRVNGPLSNLPEFHEAFGCKEGDKMYRKPEERVKIW
ncbi:MAG: peptidase M13 [Thermonema sp.]|uniref:M13 family metallopeptidase n=1 Tax=Thermonema sp. TaxID=2231181 RepID=UPI0021DEFE89|nr:M13 family metallopeptidase [Thermonema sp.]GIV38285.1 MAG: peptidase M13 [Thermonema sp.]